MDVPRPPASSQAAQSASETGAASSTDPDIAAANAHATPADARRSYENGEGVGDGPGPAHDAGDVAEMQAALVRWGAYGGFVMSCDLAAPQFGQFHYVSDRFAGLLGWPAELLADRCLWDLQPVATQERTRERLRAWAASDEWPPEFTDVFVHRELRDVYLSIRFSRDLSTGSDAAGRPLRVLGFAHIVQIEDRDVAPLQQKYDELQDVHNELRQANERLGRLLAMLAHDLKSGMAAVLGLAQALDSRLGTALLSSGEPVISEREKMATRELPPATEEVGVTRKQLRTWADMAYHANRAAESVEGLLDDLVTLKALQSGKRQIKAERVFVESLLRDAVDSTQSVFRSKDVTVVRRVVPREDGKPLVLYADRQAVLMVLRNLLTNAAKFTPRGRVVSIAAVTDEVTGAVSISVADEGVGIPPAKVSDLFDVTRPTSTPGTEGERGTGFGLPICHEIMAAHGGVLLVESEPDQGSTFTARFPQGDQPET